jgi:hypothetical protein
MLRDICHGHPSVRHSSKRVDAMAPRISVSCDLLISSRFVGSFDEFSFLEPGAGTNQGDEVRGVDGAPAGLCRLDELERHRDSGGPRAGSLGDPLP